jgi:tRNA A-37 threonylcarbamoyl transferase component Bud32
MRSRIRDFQPFVTEGGMTLDLGLPVCTVSYVTNVRVEDKFGRKDTRPVEQQLQILKTAEGEKVSELLKQGPELEMLRQIGQAIAEFHKQYRTDEPSADRGFRTIVHGDFYGPNMFFDGESNKLTLIDLAGMGKSVVQAGGSNMLIDVKRMMEQGLGILNNDPPLVRAEKEAQQQAFLEGYCAGLAGLRDENDRPFYTPERLRELIQAPEVEAFLG